MRRSKIAHFLLCTRVCEWGEEGRAEKDEFILLHVYTTQMHIVLNDIADVLKVIRLHASKKYMHTSNFDDARTYLTDRSNTVFPRK